MNRIVSPVSVIAIVALAASEHASTAYQATPGRYEHLGSDPLVHIPADLTELVSRAEAAVVADIVGFAAIESRTTTSTTGTPLGRAGIARYKVRIKDVLYNRRGKSAPPLGVGGTSDLLSVVGREGAQAFEMRTNVRQGDECILFLWHRRGADAWSLAPWQLQFKRSLADERKAESVTPIDSTSFLAGTLEVTHENNRETVDWASLVSEIRRMSRAK